MLLKWSMSDAIFFNISKAKALFSSFIYIFFLSVYFISYVLPFFGSGERKQQTENNSQNASSVARRSQALHTFQLEIPNTGRNSRQPPDHGRTLFTFSFFFSYLQWFHCCC